jgi:SAM-dependent methyltransferase
MITGALVEIFCCPDCRADLVMPPSAPLACQACGRGFTSDNGIIDMMPRATKALPPAYNDPDYRRMSGLFDESTPYFTDGNSIFKTIHDSAHATVAQWERQWPAQGWTIDIGCGQGYHWPFAADRQRLIGFDIRLDSLARIRQQWPEAILIRGDVLNMPFKAGHIQRATSVYALEHLFFLEDALSEIARVLAPQAKFLVGIPCEGGLAWTLGRKLTSERAMSKRYNLDYRKYIALEHCNTAARIEKALGFYFRKLERRFFPFDFLPTPQTNLTLSLALERM